MAVLHEQWDLGKGNLGQKAGEGGECLRGVLGTLAGELSKSQLLSPISDKWLEGKAMDFLLTVCSDWGQGSRLRMKGLPSESLRSQ